MTNSEKAKLSRAYGQFYLVFDRGWDVPVRWRLLDQAMTDARDCGGEIWLSGRCVVPSWNVK